MSDSQLQQKQEAAEAGADDPGSNDHYDKVLDTVEKASSSKMNQILSNAQDALAKLTVRGMFNQQMAQQLRGMQLTMAVHLD